MKAYVAISKKTGSVISGARGQKVFDDAGTLRKSIGQDYWIQSQAREQGVKPKDLYDVHEFELNLEDNENTVTISKDVYEFLTERNEKLSALEDYGVDNWSGYSDAMQAMNEEEN